jgi:hypothetical protein
MWADKHYLESWSDARGFDGTISIVQPLIKPLYDGHNAHELVQLFFRENFDKKDLDIVKEFWQTQTINITASAPSESAEGGHQTAAANTAQATASPTPRPSPVATPTARPAATPAAGATTAAATANFEDKWRRIVHDGVVPNSALPAKTLSANSAFLSQPETRSPSSVRLRYLSFRTRAFTTDGSRITVGCRNYPIH